MSGARTRGPRPISTQVDGGGVCSGSTVGPSLPAVQPQVLLPRGLVSRSSGDPLPPGRVQPDVDPVQGLCGAARTVCGLGFTDLPLCLEGRNRALPSQHTRLPLCPPLSSEEDKPAVAGEGPFRLCRDVGLMGI